MKNWIFFLSLATATANASPQCPFRGRTVEGLGRSPRFQAGPEKSIEIPQPLIDANPQFFRDYRPKRCAGAFARADVFDRDTQQAYFYIRTTKDDCDGGNTYGLIFAEGAKAVGFIADSAMDCY